MEVEFKKLREDVVIPTYAHDGDAGLDLTAVSHTYDEENDCWIYGTGIAVAIPKGYFGDIRARSSNKKTECYLSNGAGVVDSTYRGELILVYKDRTSKRIANAITAISNACTFMFSRFGFNVQHVAIVNMPPYNIGDRIGQLVISPCPNIQLKEVKELSETARGTNGYGSTGK